MCGNDHCGWSISYILNVMFMYITAMLFSYFLLSRFIIVMNCVCVRACVSACVRVCVRACVRACVRECVRECVWVRQFMRVRACVHICVCSRARVEQCMCV